MDLIDKITVALNESDLISPIVDISFDRNGNVFGTITSSSFEGKTDSEAQKLIWDILRKHIDRSDLLKIFMIFHEVPRETYNRYQDIIDENIPEQDDETEVKSKYWFHITPERAKYWSFIDVAKIDGTYKAVYLIINAKTNFHKGLIYNYPYDVLEFMEINQENFYYKLLKDVFRISNEEIRGDLLHKYEEKQSEGFIGRSNIYSYIFYTFKLRPCSLSKMIFNESEISLLSKYLDEIKEFELSQDLLRAIEISKIINNNVSPLES